ncbi:permease, partial [Acinetobacter terrae]
VVKTQLLSLFVVIVFVGILIIGYSLNLVGQFFI